MIKVEMCFVWHTHETKQQINRVTEWKVISSCELIKALYHADFAVLMRLDGKHFRIVYSVLHMRLHVYYHHFENVCQLNMHDINIRVNTTHYQFASKGLRSPSILRNIIQLYVAQGHRAASEQNHNTYIFKHGMLPLANRIVQFIIAAQCARHFSFLITQSQT